MRLRITDKNGKHVRTWVAMTKHGFNRKQKREIARIREQLRKEDK